MAERHSVPGRSERHSLAGPPERHSVAGRPERHSVPGTPERPGRQRPGRPRKHRGLAPGMAATADRFAALADGTRRHLLEQLAAADRPVSELMTGSDISPGAGACR